MNKIIISENIYNGDYGKQSVFENSVIIILNNDEEVSDIVNDKINSANYKRTFVDNDLDFISIELPAPVIDNYDELEKCLKELTNDDDYLINKDLSFNLADYLNKITVIIDDKEYEVLRDSDLGSKIIKLSKLDELSSKTNKDIINAISM